MCVGCWGCGLGESFWPLSFPSPSPPAPLPPSGRGEFVVRGVGWTVLVGVWEGMMGVEFGALVLGWWSEFCAGRPQLLWGEGIPLPPLPSMVVLG